VTASRWFGDYGEGYRSWPQLGPRSATYARRPVRQPWSEAVPSCCCLPRSRPTGCRTRPALSLKRAAWRVRLAGS